MQSLEELLRDAAGRGQLNHVSLIFTRDGFECSYRDTKHDGSRFAFDRDPAEAMRKALTAKPVRAPKPADDLDFG